MNTYLELALRYLKMNKKRSAVTIFAVTVAVAILYMGLNVGWCELLKARNCVSNRSAGRNRENKRR